MLSIKLNNLYLFHEQLNKILFGRSNPILSTMNLRFNQSSFPQDETGGLGTGQD